MRLTHFNVFIFIGSAISAVSKPSFDFGLEVMFPEMRTKWKWERWLEIVQLKMLDRWSSNVRSMEFGLKLFISPSVPNRFRFEANFRFE